MPVVLYFKEMVAQERHVTRDEPFIQPKTKGGGIMVSDFIDQHSGFHPLTDEEHCLACVSDAHFPKSALVLFEYSAECKEYWTSEKNYGKYRGCC